MLVRAGSAEKLEAIAARLGGDGRVHAVAGDLSAPLLGVDAATRDALRGNVDHFFHLAAVYDMTAGDEENTVGNVEGTQHAVELAEDLRAGVFHHASSIAVAGAYEGHFTEDMFDEGQPLPSAYHRTKYEAEAIVRRSPGVWRVYRPSIVVGDSRSGEMDKIDGPYYFFKLIQKLRHALPEWFPLVSLEVGWTNIVPVDWVAAAMDHIAHEPDLDRQAFHLVNPRPQRSGDVLNTFARAGHAPRVVMRVDKRLTDMLPKASCPTRSSCRRSRTSAATAWPTSASPTACSSTWRSCRSSTAVTRSARCAAAGSTCRRSRPTPTGCGTTGSATSIPTCSRTALSPARSTAGPS